MTNKNSIEYLAYLLDKAKNQKKDKAIVFLGAGASVSAGIPLTNVIIRHIRLKFRKNPLIKNHTLNNITDYYDLMGLLTADERRDLFHFYVTREKVKLNIANIYLAQLLKEGYVDYIITVNFDDLILKACTLFNFLPPVYDVSNIKTITTTDIRTGSVIYLHGQYFGQWLLNNIEELKKVEDEVLSFFNSIKTRRTWVVVGYSGNDGIFDKIKSLGSFSNELFWIKKKIEATTDNHILEFLKTPNLNVHSIEGYYADSFFLKLHAELSKLNSNLNPPDVFYKPFSFMKSVISNVNEINFDDELNKEVNAIIENCKNRIEKAISSFELALTIEDFKQKIIDCILREEFNEEILKEFKNEIEKNEYYDAIEELSYYLNGWGIYLYNNWKDTNDENLLYEALDKLNESLNINSKNKNTHNELGVVLQELAKLNSDENLYYKSIKSFEKAIELNPKNSSAYNNLGIVYQGLGNLKEELDFFYKSNELYKRALELDQNNSTFYNNWGNSLSDIAEAKEDEKLFLESFEKYDKAIELDSNNSSIYNNWVTGLLNYYHLKNVNKKAILKEALEKALKAYILNNKNTYNLACCYSLINNKEESLKFLEESLKNKSVTADYVKKDKDFKNLIEVEEFKKLLYHYNSI